MTDPAPDPAFTLTMPDAAAMEALGRRLAALLRAGDLVVLSGELGAGKTKLARGVGAGLGAVGAVTSPTFVIARTHPTATVPFVHVDAYRLGDAAELDDLDLDLPGSIVLVEWGAAFVAAIADEWLELMIDRPTGGDPLGDEAPRRVQLVARGARATELAAALSG